MYETSKRLSLADILKKAIVTDQSITIASELLLRELIKMLKTIFTKEIILKSCFPLNRRFGKCTE